MIGIESCFFSSVQLVLYLSNFLWVRPPIVEGVDVMPGHYLSPSIPAIFPPSSMTKSLAGCEAGRKGLDAASRRANRQPPCGALPGPRSRDGASEPARATAGLIGGPW